MSQRGKDLLLIKYYRQGWLSRRYYDGKAYHQPYSADDRLQAGKRFYVDFVMWQRASFGLRAIDLTRAKTDGGPLQGDISLATSAERFRQALRHVSKTNLPILYKIILEEKEISAPQNMSVREKLYFNDEIKGLLCRGLDELIPYYQKLL